ncbi:MAG: putative protein phosphatase 2C, partial [Marinobacter sp. T13-3]
MTSRTERILIIDADEQAREDLSRYLESKGFYVTGRAKLTEALTLSDDELPDVIFADLPPETIQKVSEELEADGHFVPLVA